MTVVLALVVGAAGAAPAAEDTTGDISRPLYLEIRGTAESQAVLPDDLIEAMAREVISPTGRAVLTTDDDALPAGVQVLRLMVLVSQQSDEAGAAMSAAATTSLLVMPAEGGSARLVYQGMQQELATGPSRQVAAHTLRDHFKQALQQRVRAALDSGR
ncbi:hypothetical protein V5738_06655 [Salinisphaera sp. SPP-AMP-43]|uniref:hypothetical protein n=1 Tax=Salinisphaera sp. SPP-AMP-43 TaxID=3121288 RepID=UPI003C6DBD1A